LEATAHAANLSVYAYRKLERGLTSPGQPINPGLRTMAALAKVLERGLDGLVHPPNSLADLRKHDTVVA